MKRWIVPVLLFVLWLLLWAADTGVLVYSRTEYIAVREYRTCFYLIGMSVERQSREVDFQPRCRLLSGL